MRILLTSNASYLPPRGGSTRSNLAYLHALVEHGHSVRVVATAAEKATPEQQAKLQKELAEQQLEQAAETGNLDGIEIVSIDDLVRHADILKQQVASFEPDWVLVSSEDISHTLLRQAAVAAGERLIYIAHTPQFFPFGPESWHPDERATQLLRQAAVVIVISESMSRYVEMHLGRPAYVVHPPMYKQENDGLLGNFESGVIAIVNPCAVKGISIFLAAAELLPEQSFAALPGWGTTEDDYRQLDRQPNVQIVNRVRHIETFLQSVKILLMPSLWLEGFGLIAMEAMLCGVPVIASDSGGLREAKAGTQGLLPVHLIDRYHSQYDDRKMPKPVIPSQDVEPWVQTIRAWTKNESTYRAIATGQQVAARQFVSGVDRYSIEQLLTSLQGGAHLPDTSRGLASQPVLSQSRQQLLLNMLKSRTAKDKPL